VHDDGAEYTVDWDDDDTKLRRQPREVRPKRLVIGSPWLQFASECQRFGHPPRLNGSPFGTQHLRPLLDVCDAALRRSYTGPRGPDTALQLRSRRLKCAGREGGRAEDSQSSWWRGWADWLESNPAMGCGGGGAERGCGRCRVLRAAGRCLEKLRLAGQMLPPLAGAAAAASFLAAVLTEICLCNVCSGPEMLRRDGRGQAWTCRGWRWLPGTAAGPPSS
jgi:hypothetical protein